MSCFWSCKLKWSEVKVREIEKTYIGMIYPQDVRGKTFTTTEQYQDATCPKCGKYYTREIKV